MLATFTLGGAAFAVTSLQQTGSPVAYPFGKPAPGKGLGTPVEGTVRMLTDTVKDPQGGLPWGLRSFATSRGYTCLQVGRVLEGKLGVLGRDRQFHELRPGVVTSGQMCGANDGAGKGFLALHIGAFPSSGDRYSCSARPSPGLPRCRDSELRSLDFGLLGAGATALTTRAGASVPLLGPDRGYLVVGPGRKPRIRHLARVSYLVDDSRAALTPASPVLARVEYGERTCRVTATDNARGSCGAPPGFVPIPQPDTTHVRTPVSVKVVHGTTARVRFTARVAVTDNTSAYNVMIYPPKCGVEGAVSAGIEHNVAVGETVVKDIRLPCRRSGEYRVVVSYRTRGPYPRPGSSLQFPGATVDRVTITR